MIPLNTHTHTYYWYYCQHTSSRQQMINNKQTYGEFECVTLLRPLEMPPKLEPKPHAHYLPNLYRYRKSATEVKRDRAGRAENFSL